MCVLQDDEQRTILTGEAVPFSPTQTAPEYPTPSTSEILHAWSQRWRAPLTLVFGLLIAGAAFFAYQNKQDTATVPDAAAGFRVPAGPTTTRDSGASTANALGRDSGSGSGPQAAGGDDLATASSAPPPATVVAPTTPTTRSTASTTSTTVANAPVFIGGRVSTDAPDGRGLADLTVTLLSDSDGDGNGDDQIAVATTATDGGYSFEPDPGCYVVAFSVPSGMQILLGAANVALCLESGQSYAQADLVLGAPSVRAPASCNVQIANNFFAGVEIWDPNRDFAPSYVFYGASGNVIARTAELGPPDDIFFPNLEHIEWTSFRYGYEESDVYSVAAVDSDGAESAPVTCERLNV